MIQDLEVYINWKLSTLDRITAKYKSQFSRILNDYLEKHRGGIEFAIEAGHTTYPFNIAEIEHKLRVVLESHQRETVYVGVSDGFREVTPTKELSTWTKYPYHYPVEMTFKNLAERSTRDRLFENIAFVLNRKHRFTVGKILSLQKARYLKIIRTVFRVAAEGYLKEEEGTTSRDVVRDMFKTIFKKTNSESEMIVRTETTRYFNDARIIYFKENTDVDFVELATRVDKRTSNICTARAYYVIPISKCQIKRYRPPFHPNCRTVQTPLISSIKSHAARIKENLGVEFKTVHSETSDKDFTGHRPEPTIPLPQGWG